jgi:hypothetical protein
MSSTPERRHRTAGGAAGLGVSRRPIHRGVSRIVTLVLAVGFAVVGVAGAASAHHNTITATVACKTEGGGWAVTWTVVNSETITEKITGSNRPSVVPVGTTFTSRQTKTFSETITAKPTANVTLKLDAKWTNGNTNTSYGTIPVASFTDNCLVKTVQPPTIPVVDDCGPGNAHYGQVPSGPWTSVTNPDGSVTVTANSGNQFPGGKKSVTYPVPADSNVPCPALFQVTTVPVIDDCGPGNAHYGQIPTGPWTATVNPDGSLTVTAAPGHQFPNGQTVLTFPAPTDSNQPCPTPPVVTPPVVTPPVVTPPVVTPPEVLPAEARVVSARARKIDKCGTRGDVYKVVKRSGVVYTSKGKVLRQGVWLKAGAERVTVRAHAADASYRLQGKQVWKMTFRTRPCASAPEVAPSTGAR